MTEAGDKEGKTEEPTHKKITDELDRGNIPLSREAALFASAVALLVSHVSVADLQRELTRFPNAQLVESDMPPAAVAAVQNALAEANREPFTG